MKVFVKIDDQDTHDEGCGCGKCNSNGKSYGAGVYEYGHIEPLFREYAASEKSALHSANMEAEKAGHKIVPESEAFATMRNSISFSDKCHSYATDYAGKKEKAAVCDPLCRGTADTLIRLSHSAYTKAYNHASGCMTQCEIRGISYDDAAHAISLMSSVR